ncbi:F-box family protein [Thalictrum thalictroides]|uniref:F-box family protein n=1 Tax=Thalictrum thalictroides TaxID=46969 RepID=A0A7J6WPR4_THATH|nr:F-box family protein [Thalictrum thalictroides]
MAENNKNKGGCDQISFLHDGLLCYILGFLPILDAVRTCVLSTRWRYVWQSIPSLNFDIDKARHPEGYIYEGNLDDEDVTSLDVFLGELDREPKVVDIIDRVLSSHCGNVDCCLIKYYMRLDLNFNGLVRSIEELIMSKKIRKLTLRCYKDRNSEEEHSFPFGLFTSQSLHVLELNWCHIPNPSPFHGCSNLTHLSLTDVVLTDEVFHEIIANSVSLKKLILRHLYTVSKLSIINANLEFLELRFIVADEIEVIAENLEELTVGVLVFRSHYIKLRTPRLHCYVSGKKADQAYYYAPNLMKSVEILQMCTSLLRRVPRLGWIYPFENLQIVSIILDLKDMIQVNILSHILLKLCTQLETLHIKGDDEVLSQQSDHSFECPYAYPTFWEGQKLHNSISNHLTELELTGFKGDLTEITFLRYIMTNATKMKKMVIQCDNNCSIDGVLSATELLYFPKISIDLALELKPCPSYLAMEGGNFKLWLESLA